MTERPDVAYSNPVTQAGFTMFPNVVLLRRDLSPAAKLVYAYLGFIAWKIRDGGGEVDPPRAVIARDLNLSVPTVTKLVQELCKAPAEEGGDKDGPRLVASVRRGQGRTNAYLINDPSRKKDSFLLESKDVALPARARHSVSGTSLRSAGNPKSEKQDNAREEPPDITWLDGRNVPLDTLCRVTGVDEAGPRFDQAKVALYGRLDRAGKLKEQGIRHLFWLECVRYAEAHDALDKIDLAYTDEHEGWILALAQRIEQKASKWVEVYRDAALSPQALRNHWLDLELAPSRGGMTADEIARFEG